MKILYMSHPQMDTGGVLLFMGLCEVLGPENIVTFPPVKMFYGITDDHKGPYTEFLRQAVKSEPLPQGIPPFAPGEDVINGWPDAFDLPYLVSQTTELYREYKEDEIVAQIKAGAFSFIVLTSGHRINTIALARLRDKLGGNLPSIVYLDSGERDEMNEHWTHVFQPKIIFKSVLTPEVYNYAKTKYGWELHPLPHSSVLVGKNIKAIFDKLEGDEVYELPPVGSQEEIARRGTAQHMRQLLEKRIPQYITFNGDDKVVDCFYGLGATYDKRRELLDVLHKYFATSYYIGIERPGLRYFRYLNMIAHSRTAISMRGSGRDTTRYWEIPLFKTLLICDGTMGAMHPHPFEHGKTAVFYEENNLKQVPELLDYYLSHETERRQIANAGYEHVMKYHTMKARAEYFLDIVRQNGVT